MTDYRGCALIAQCRKILLYILFITFLTTSQTKLIQGPCKISPESGIYHTKK